MANLGQVPAGAPPPFTATAGIPRFGASYAPTLQAINRWFSLHDDMKFGEDALPPAGAAVQKGGRYTWAYLLRRPRAFSDAVVDMSSSHCATSSGLYLARLFPLNRASAQASAEENNCGSKALTLPNFFGSAVSR